MTPAEIYENLSREWGENIGLSEDQNALILSSRKLISFLQLLNERFGFTFLSALTAVDYPDRYEMIYHLMSLEDASLVTVKVHLEKSAPSIPSIAVLWPAANVQEREVYDLFGIQFEGHPNLHRILNPDDFDVFPLRKGFMLSQADRQSYEVLMMGRV